MARRVVSTILADPFLIGRAGDALTNCLAEALLGSLATHRRARARTCRRQEFKEFLPIMQITLREDIAMRVFETFDDDGKGAIDFSDFVMGVFPAQHYYMSAIGRASTESPAQSL